MESDSFTGLAKVLEAAEGPSNLARLLGNITSQAICQWKRVPPERVISVSNVTGVSPHIIRPDLYPAPFSENGENVSPRKSSEVTQ